MPTTIMTGLRDAAPVGDIAVFRNTAATWRRYDHMPRYPAGVVVIGDALCTLDPIWGQGMTMAAVQALTLRDCLRDGDPDLPRRFFSAAAGHIGPTWAMNRANDRAPLTDGAKGTSARTNQQVGHQRRAERRHQRRHAHRAVVPRRQPRRPTLHDYKTPCWPHA